MDTLRFALRSLRRAPGFTAAAVLVLAIGIGANATMFGVVDTLLLRPPPHVQRPDEVVRIYGERMIPGMGRRTFSSIGYLDLEDLRAGVPQFAAVAGFTSSEVTSGRGGDARSLRAGFGTHDFFPLLGVRPALGRFFTPDEDDPRSPAQVAVLDHGFWQREFGGDPAVLGREIPLGNGRYTVVGVAPRGFTGVDLRPVDLWLPMSAMGQLVLPAEAFTSRNWSWFEPIARLAPGASRQAAAAAATQVRRNAYPDAENQDSRIILGPVMRDRGPERSRNATVSLWLGGVSVVVLLVACANVANLLLVRALRRRREIAVRLALGISRARLVRELGAEALLLALAGGAAGLLLAQLGGRIVRRVLLTNVADVPIGMDARVLLFTLGATLLTALLSGLVPALQTSRPDLTVELKSGSREGVRTHRRLRDGLVVAQMALTILLLVGAGLFVRSLRHATTLDIGLDAPRLLVAHVRLDQSHPGADRSGVHTVDALYGRMLQEVRGLPGVDGASLAVITPFRGRWSRSVSIPGRDSLPPPPTGGPYENAVTPDFFRVAGIAVRRGRALTDADVTGAPVVVVNEALARLYFPDEDPVGRCLRVGENATTCHTIVGVMEDVKESELREAAAPQLYFPLAAGDTTIPPMRVLFVRAADGMDPSALVAPVRRAMQGVAADLPYANVRPFTELYEHQLRPWELGATMFTIFGSLALLLAVVGLYAVLAYGVSQRTHEMGVRMALGAQRAHVVGLVVRQGLVVALGGVALGVLGAALGARQLRDQLFGVEPLDPATFAGVTLTLLAVAVLASWLPARRASRVDPVEALRVE